MNVDLSQELLNELGSSLENLETQHAALLQFLKDKEVLTDDQFAPHLAHAGKASSVRWRAARIRLESLFRSERQREEKLAESGQHQAAGAQVPIQNQEHQEREAKTKNDAASPNAAPQSEVAKTNGAVAGSREQSLPEKDDNRDEHGTNEDKKPSPNSEST